MGATIHPTAIVDPNASIGAGTTIGPYTVIGPHVSIGQDNRIGSHVVIEGHTTIGNENVIYQFASVGAAPQDLKYRGEPSTLIIGNKNLIREYVTLQPGTAHGHMESRIGDQNLFMACSHVGHDAIIGNKNVFANSTALAGHVTVGNGVTLGGMCGIHQFVRVGDFCILGAGSMVSKDVPPYTMGQGDRAALVGLNQVGLKRNGFSEEQITRLRKLYREVLLAKGKLKEKVEQARDHYRDLDAARAFLDFIAKAERGVTLPRRHGGSDAEEQ